MLEVLVVLFICSICLLPICLGVTTWIRGKRQMSARPNYMVDPIEQAKSSYVEHGDIERLERELDAALENNTVERGPGSSWPIDMNNMQDQFCRSSGLYDECYPNTGGNLNA